MSDKETVKAGVQAVCQDIYDRDGEVKTKALIDAARPKTSPAHSAFCWDNEEAGERYREMQARKWIRAVTIVRDEQPERLIHVPKVVNDDTTDGRDGHYQVASALISRPDEFDRALAQATIKLGAARRAVDELYRAADSTGRSDQAAMIAQMSRATEMWAEALSAMH